VRLKGVETVNRRTGAILVIALVAATVGVVAWRLAADRPSGGASAHRTQVDSGSAGEAMEMPRPSEGGVLGRELGTIVTGPADLPRLTLLTRESGFFDFNSIVQMQEEPEAARIRYEANGLVGGYQRVFKGTSSLREVQASILRFETNEGAAKELEFGRTEEATLEGARRLAPPFRERSFAFASSADVDGLLVNAVEVSWVHGSDVSVVFVAGQPEKEVVKAAMDLADKMARRQEGKA
jgi:hypothetical protein